MSVRPLVLLFTLLSSPALAQDLQTAEQQLATALAGKDVAAIEQLLARSFVLRGSPDVPRETWIKNALSLCWGDKFEISEFTVVSQTGDVIAQALGELKGSNDLRQERRQKFLNMGRQLG